MARILFPVCILLLFQAIMINALERRSKTQVDVMIGDICERLYEDEDFYSDGNRKWLSFCEEWIKIKDHRRYEVAQDKKIIEEPNMAHMIQPRRVRVGGFRFSSGGSRSGSRSSVSSIARFRNTRTGAKINHQNGWQWSRSRLMFLPLSTRYVHRSHSSSSRFTTPATNSVTHYYCTLTNDSSTEIQCTSIDGDTQCCEDDTTHQAFCCGGKVSEDFVRDVNRAVKIFTQMFYTLTTITLSIHVFMRRSYR